MKIFFATWLTDISLGNSLTVTGGNNRLVSYHFILEQKVTTKHMKRYSKTGRADIRQKKKKKK